MPPFSLLVGINEWLESNTDLIPGYRISKHEYGGTRFDIYNSNDRIGIIILSKGVDSGAGHIHAWSMTEHHYVDYLLTMAYIDNETVEFDAYGFTDFNIKYPDELSKIMSAANPLFFDWMRDWFKIVIYGMDSIRKPKSP